MLGRTSSEERNNSGLAARRRRRRRRALLVFLILLSLLMCAIIWGLRQPSVRISNIQIFNADRQLVSVVVSAMQGNYFGLIPRDSIFFFPKSRIRSSLLFLNPDFAAVSIFRNGFTDISVKIDYRVPVARWCGSSPVATSTDCYLFDAKGFVFSTSSSMVTINSSILYEQQSGEIIGSTLQNAQNLPYVFNFARQVSFFGSPVSSIVIRGDEIDNYLLNGTRITYLLGDEQNAFTSLVSAKISSDLVSGLVEYVDLRFNGKVYLKKK